MNIEKYKIKKEKDYILTSVRLSTAHKLFLDTLDLKLTNIVSVTLNEMIEEYNKDKEKEKTDFVEKSKNTDEQAIKEICGLPDDVENPIEIDEHELDF